MQTPWGVAQQKEELAPGIWKVSTASHGGLMLDWQQAATLPKAIQAAAERYGKFWCYEEDCAVGLVYEHRLDLVKANYQSQLDSWSQTMLRLYLPDWAKRDGPGAIASLREKLALSDEEMLKPYVDSNREYFPELFGLGPRCENCRKLNCPGHAGEWIVVSATSGSSWEPPVPEGMVGVTAVLGGRDRQGHHLGEKRHFLVPREEYGNGGHACFVVDVERHAAWPQEKPDQPAVA